MAVELEQEIMRAIGLDRHYSCFCGSGSCEYIRREAAKRLPCALQRYHDAGREVEAPNTELCTLLSEVADYGDEECYTLRNTWCAASYVIQSHLYLYYAKDTQQQRKIIDDCVREIRRSHLPVSGHRWHREGSKYGQ